MLDITNYLGHFGRKKRDHSDFRFLREKSSPPRQNTRGVYFRQTIILPPSPFSGSHIYWGGGRGGVKIKNRPLQSTMAKPEIN